MPADPGRPTMYVCGPTVYSYPHIGNARSAVVFDLLFRLLKHRFGDVLYARNVTDIEDKIIKAAQEQGVPTERDRRTLHAGLSCRHGGAERPAADHRAVRDRASAADAGDDRDAARAEGHAYQAEGHVLFHVPSFAAYGRLSRRTREEMIDGARVEVAPYKRDPADFVLWKPSSPEQPGWDSAVWPRPARLAHRVLGDDRGASRHHDRHPRRRPGSAVPAPRERARAEQLRPWRRAARPVLGAQRLPQRRAREDGEVGRQRPAGARPAAGGAGRGDPLCPARHPLPQAAGLDVGQPGRRRNRRSIGSTAPSSSCRGRSEPAESAAAGACSRRSRTTSTRPRRSPSCSRWPIAPTPAAMRASGARSSGSCWPRARSWGCSGRTRPPGSGIPGRAAWSPPRSSD